MSCYDTVKIPCPKCGTRYKKQSKAGDCGMATYGLHDEPVKILADIADEKMQCGQCGAYFELQIMIGVMPVICDIESKEAT